MKIQIEATTTADLPTVWKAWTSPEHIIHWNAASPDWHSPRSESDLRVGGRFSTRMEARDGSMGFDFGGTFTQVEPEACVAFEMDDQRTVSVVFTAEAGGTRIVEVFDAEDQNSAEMQRDGWQSILNNFVTYVETDSRARQ